MLRKDGVGAFAVKGWTGGKSYSTSTNSFLTTNKANIAKGIHYYSTGFPGPGNGGNILLIAHFLALRDYFII